MNARLIIRRAFLALGIVMLLGSSTVPLRAQGNCMTFGQARQAGLFAGIKLRSAASVKQAVESRTGGKVVSFVVCSPGPVYQLTVIGKNGNVVTITEPAQ